MSGKELCCLYFYVILCCFVSAITGFITTTSIVRGFYDKPVTLECHFNGDDNWLLLQWLRRRPSDGAFVPIVSALEPSDESVWGTHADSSFVTRLKIDLRKKDGFVHFNLIFNKLTCDDHGNYKCVLNGQSGRQYSDTELIVQALPMKPTIHVESSIAKVNTQVILECYGNMGLPAAELQWFKKSDKEHLFLLVDNQEDQITEQSFDCRHFATKFLNIKITSHSGGDTYRCAAEGQFVSASDPSYYDDVIINIPEIVVETPLSQDKVNVTSPKIKEPTIKSSSISNSGHNNRIPILLLYYICLFSFTL